MLGFVNGLWNHDFLPEFDIIEWGISNIMAAVQNKLLLNKIAIFPQELILKRNPYNV